MTTIKDIAKRANTSIATVSRVLNNQTGFSEETKQTVLQAVKELGYESNAIARSMVSKKTQTIGVVFPNISSMITHELLNGIEDVAHTKEYSVIVSYSYSDSERVLKALKTFNEQRVDGLLFTSDYLTDEYYEYIQKMNVPVVLLATKSQKHQLPYVKVDDFEASYAAVNYLINKGHTEIGMLSGNPQDLIAGSPRLAGYKKALQDAALVAEERKIVYGDDFSFQDGKRNLPVLLNQYPEMTAVFSASDSMAVGAISAAHEKNMRLPEELSIVGYDNILISEMVTPSLTTLGQPLEEMGYAAAKMLLQLVEEKEALSQPILMPYKIIERGSVAELE